MVASSIARALAGWLSLQLCCALKAAVPQVGSEGSQLAVQRRRYVYLCMGPNVPPYWLVWVSERPDSDAVFLVYKPWLNTGPVGQVRVVVATDTTWATGRNVLYQEAMRMQRLQGWSHEYVVFADVDAGLLPDQADMFHRRISALQPAVAAVGWRNHCSPFPCSADVDGRFIAFHATAAPIYLPYDAALDKESWWAAQEIVIALLLMSAPEYVVEFTDIQVGGPRDTGNSHAPYPRGFKQAMVMEHLASTASSCVRSQLQSPEIAAAIMRAGSSANCRKCLFTAACLNNTFCEGLETPPPVDYGRLISCKRF